MTREKSNKSIVSENVRLQNEVDKLSRALLEVKHAKSFYMVSSDTIFNKDGVYRTVRAHQFYCRKKDAMAFMKAAISELPSEHQFDIKWSSTTSVECVGDSMIFRCSVEKINPI